MTWFKVEDTLAFHAKTIAAGNAAMGLWVRAGSWSSQQVSEGYVPSAMVRSLGTVGQARALVQAGLWVEEDGGYRFHEWLGRNPSRVRVEEERAAAAERQKRARDTALSRRDSRRDGGVMSRRDERCDNGVSHGPPVSSRPVPGLGQVFSSSVQSDARQDRQTDDGPTDELLTAWARPLPGVDIAVEAAAFRATNAGRWHELRDIRRAWAGWLTKATERNRPTPTPGTPECPVHPGQPTGSKACPDCTAEAAPAPNLRALRGAP